VPKDAVERAGARIGDVGDDRRAKLRRLTDEGGRIHDVAVVIADIDDRRRERGEHAQHLEIDFAVVARAEDIPHLENVAVDDDRGLAALVRRDEIANRFRQRRRIGVAGMKVGHQDQQKVGRVGRPRGSG
jgi:hypothetical protein